MKGLLAIDKIHEIDAFLYALIEDNQVINYKIVLQLGMRIEVNILLPIIKGKKWYFEQEPFKDFDKIIRINEIEFDEELATQKEYELIFTQKIDLGLRRRLSNFINFNDKKVKKPCPVITFYSYKGGVGRTTSLAFFASWLATHHGKKVVVLDCDFEAPGFSNYFDISEDKKGVVEYLLDTEYAKMTGEILDIQKDYAYKVRYEYVGKGDIFIVPAGNLSNEKIGENGIRTHRSDYLEALARLDITSINHIIEQFEAFFADLQTQLGLDYENSVILIDSRTGFNDTFAILSTLSDIIVGFFGINKQSQVGLTQFLDTFGETEQETEILMDNMHQYSVKQDKKEIMIVKSFHNTSTNGWKEFKKIIETYVKNNQQKFVNENLGFPDFTNNLFRINVEPVLENMGTALEDDNRDFIENGGSTKEKVNIDFIDLVKRPSGNFEILFLGIQKQIDFLTKNLFVDDIIIDEYQPLELIIEQKIDKERVNLSQFLDSVKDKVDKIAIRERLLRTLIQPESFPQSYADSKMPELADFYFRDCMKDIFNRDKFLIIGYKGTGKTHIYQSFKKQEITDILCKREQQISDNYLFVNVIPIYYQKKDDNDSNIDETHKYFSTNSKFSTEELKILGEDFFYERFWMAYTWNEIFSNSQIQQLNIQLSAPTIPINNDNTTANWFRSIIGNNTLFSDFENDLKSLDDKLKNINKILVLSFDQLDFVVKPENWSIGIAPLITYWRTNIFSRIYPKIFVRADIFENRLSNITNINELQVKSINLQWSKQELFAYFFKYVFKVGKYDFFALSYAYKDYAHYAKMIMLNIEKDLDNEGQIPLVREDYLRFLVEIFFGKYVNLYKENNAFGESYDWFFNNLTDAKATISIRPFLDLIHSAIELALTEKQLIYEKRNWQYSKKIISPYYYVNHNVRAKSAERYYKDLAKDKGNEPLFLFADYLRFRTNKPEDKNYEFQQVDFNNFLSRVINKYPNNNQLKEIKHIDDLRHLLINNGIIEVVGNGVKTRYIIPFLYRSYFGVGNPTQRTNKIK